MNSNVIPEECVKQVVCRNSSTLRIMIIAGDLPHNHLVVYPKLQQLNCRSVSDDAARQCPSLQKLSVWNQKPGSMLSLLPSGTMHELTGLLYSWPGLISVADFICGAGNFVNLNKLSIQFRSIKCSDLQMLFAKLHSLTDVRLAASYGSNLDEAIASLVHYNRRIECLQLWKVTLTDDALTSLSRLESLKKVKLITIGTKFTMPALMDLLRGGSRKSLQTMIISHQTGTDWSAIETEIDLMRKERGKLICIEKVADCIKIKCWTKLMLPY